MKKSYSLSQQRNTYLLTIKNDIVLKEHLGGKRYRFFEQFGVGQKVFKGLWDFPVFRFLVNVSLPLCLLLSDLIFPFKYSLLLLFHKKKKYELTRLYLHNERRLLALSKSANIQSESDVWFHNPFDFIKLPSEYKILTALDFISLLEIWTCAFQSVILHIKTVYRYGYDIYLLSYRAYEWCFTDFALRHIPFDVELTYSSICDRMAILYDRLPHTNKTMIQHGTMHFHNLGLSESPYFTWQEDLSAYIWNSLYKSSPSVVYCYTHDDEIALRRSVIANNPRFVIMGYGFTTAFKPQKKSLLIVGHPSLFQNEETKIISELDKLDIELYLKNHPAESNSLYDDLRRKYSFTFIEGLDNKLPDVDMIISYDSTLAYEYASIGTSVLYYGQFDIDNIKEIVKKQLAV